ncbi:ABC-type transporter ATP-binding protein EcsA [uncultured Ruminococcus sp.]|uniref:ATP-binding cassette domain-containing protein n=1 Tax=Massiliimalia timonensis TaxID=1987501 RepID=A0A8J6U166_9FIRM|nr:ATP-binding cassette domain-containing protein [Massiliimalia timonensis]MBC8611922.1 ATP-binding cassette domain-containing protein [Massiliimalia timonensis]SCG94270.1 ABC-type transporter ATP-binding protein EcsA [uncultured Clostridium sp.]SCH90069.1 ABC-type transporter ATP-binding protein EcsA [uncultured Ruminococcus sp.]
MSLIVSDLSKKYGEKTVVNHISFSMPKPGVYALLGTNGAGKTTTIRMMLGMLSKDTGSVQWNGRPLDTATCNVGYLAEERGLYPKYGLMDQLIYFAGLRGVSKHEAKTRIKYWAHRLQVEEYLYPDQVQEDGSTQLGARGGLLSGAKRKKAQKPKLADQLSKGNQQKIQFMTALISNPDLIILDEPMSGLDPVNTDLFKDIIREEIAKGKYLIMSSHQMATVEEFCTDITILDRANAVLQGNLNEIKKGYGRVNLSLKVEQDIAPYIQAAGATVLSEKEYEYQLKVTGEEQANRLLGSLIENKITIITFDLREPSLHEIFVETVGGERHETE